MKPSNGFIVSIFLFLLITPFSTQAQDNCRKVEVTVDVTHTAGGERGTITVSLKDSQTKFTLHLLSDTGENEQVKIKSGTIRNIPSGTYHLIIQYPDARYCTETRKVIVN